MQYQRWLVLAYLSLLIPLAQAQTSGSLVGNVHVHVVYADDRKAGGNLMVRLMDGSGSNTVQTMYTNAQGKADFWNVQAPGIYHVVVTGEGIQDADSGLFEVDTRKVSQAQFIEVHPTQAADARTGGAKASTVSASDLAVPSKARKEVEEAGKAISKQDWSKAVELLNQAIAIYPQYAAAYNILGVVYANMNDPVHEQQALEKAVSLDEHYAPACQNLVKLYLREKSYPQAETLLGKGLRADPNNGVYLMLMADVQYMQGHYDAAIATVQRMHTVSTDHPATAHYIAAKAYEQKNKPQDALGEMQMFLKEEPTGQRADHVRSDIAKMQGTTQATPPNAQ
jgi:tetratricopeptide (TPR) repeat protein